VPDSPTKLIDDTLAELAVIGDPATWELTGNEAGRRARAALLLMLALPGPTSLDSEDLGPGLPEFYRAALSARRSVIADAAPTLTWLGGPDRVLAFHRGNFGCMVNLSGHPVPVIGPVLLASEPIVDDLLPSQAAVWTSGLPGVDQAAQYAVHEGW
jgi:hypothetical protein